MSYYKPIQLDDGAGHPSGTWRFAVTRDEVTYAVGYCMSRRCRHKTPEEASDCYRATSRKNAAAGVPMGFLMKMIRGARFFNL